MRKIYLVDDSEIIGNSLKNHFKSWDIETVLVENFKKILEEFKEISPDLVIIDVSLPFYDGYFWTRKIRDISDVPIIFLSSRSESMDKIRAMELGADDFISKPFDIDLLIAKIRALLRRSYNYRPSEDRLEVGGLILDIRKMEVFFEEKSLELSKNEFKILESLMVHKNEVVSREKLMYALWSTDIFIDDNTLTVNISRLRKNLKSLGLGDFIKTKVGKGYYVKED